MGSALCKAYVSDSGYYIVGPEIEVYRVIRHKRTEQGQPVFDELHHNYFVMLAVLNELLEAQVASTVKIYHDTRVVDDINGTEPLDGLADSIRNLIQRVLVPAIPGTVWFHKQSRGVIDNAIAEAKCRFSTSMGPLQLPEVDKKSPMIKLKEEINTLLARSGQKEKYTIAT